MRSTMGASALSAALDHVNSLTLYPRHTASADRSSGRTSCGPSRPRSCGRRRRPPFALSRRRPPFSIVPRTRRRRNVRILPSSFRLRRARRLRTMATSTSRSTRTTTVRLGSRLRRLTATPNLRTPATRTARLRNPTSTAIRPTSLHLRDTLLRLDLTDPPTSSSRRLRLRHTLDQLLRRRPTRPSKSRSSSSKGRYRRSRPLPAWPPRRRLSPTHTQTPRRARARKAQRRWLSVRHPGRTTRLIASPLILAAFSLAHLIYLSTRLLYRLYRRLCSLSHLACPPPYSKDPSSLATSPLSHVLRVVWVNCSAISYRSSPFSPFPASESGPLRQHRLLDFFSSLACSQTASGPLARHARSQGDDGASTEPPEQPPHALTIVFPHLHLLDCRNPSHLDDSFRTAERCFRGLCEATGHY